MDEPEGLAGSQDPLDPWRSFPVHEVPRPLVLVGGTVHLKGGFESGDAKIAYLHGAVAADDRLPPGVLEAMCPQPRPRGNRCRCT